MTESIQIPPNVDPLIIRGILLSRLHDGLVRLDTQRLADLISNPVKPRVIRPARNRVLKATMEDSFHPSHQPTASVTSNTAEPGLATSHNTPYAFKEGLQPSQMGEGTAHPICKCGMGYKGVPHPCMRWHHKMMTPDAMKDFTEVVKKHAGGYIPEPTLSLDLLSEDTQAYIAQVVNPKQPSAMRGADPVQPVMVRFMPSVLSKLEKFRNDDGQRLTLKPSGKADPYGVIDIIVTIEDDPEWVRSFAKKHEEKHYAMPICCNNPDPRIAKSGRSYCHSCKKYLDKVPPPQEQTITITRPKQEVQK